MTDTPLRCPCGSGDTYDACCGRFHRGEALPATAQLLMRSRFSAFAVGDAAYLSDTWDSKSRPRTIDLDDDTRWTLLEILDTVRGGPFDVDGIVEFKAHYRLGKARGIRHERSNFVKKAGRWVYVNGETHAT